VKRLFGLTVSSAINLSHGTPRRNEGVGVTPIRLYRVLAPRWLVTCAVVVSCIPAHAGPPVQAGLPELNAHKIFLLLFLMLGPIKILAPFEEMTRHSDVKFRRQLAGRAILFSGAAMLLAVVVGRSMLDNFNISTPVLALTGGLVLFLVALRTVLSQFSATPTSAPDASTPDDLRKAFSPLAFPTIVTPYGIAAVIVFEALAGDDLSGKLTVAWVTGIILALDWLSMIFAHEISKWLGTVLHVFAVVLGVTQVALGLQVILRSLQLIGVLQLQAI
jgi:multiple antibiotic resistance protein